MGELGRKNALGGVERHNVVVEPILLDRENMAAALCISASLLDELRDVGCPTVVVPTTDKTLYDPKEVLAWMKNFRKTENIELTSLGHELRTKRGDPAETQEN